MNKHYLIISNRTNYNLPYAVTLEGIKATITDPKYPKWITEGVVPENIYIVTEIFYECEGTSNLTHTFCRECDGY